VVLDAMFDILETQKIIEGEARITLLPPKNELLPQLLAAEGGSPTRPSIPRPK
jgi:hypothetical protein